MSIAAGQRQHLEAFLEMLAAERGAAANTLQAYRRDLEDFLAFLERRAKPLTAAASAEIGAYMRAQSESGPGRPTLREIGFQREGARSDCASSMRAMEEKKIFSGYPQPESTRPLSAC